MKHLKSSSFVFCLVFTLSTHAQVYDFNEILVPKGLDELIFAEQKLINRSVDESIIEAPTIQEQSPDYRPENRKWFKLKTVWLPESEVNVAQLVESQFNTSDFIKEKNGFRFYKLIIHPESEAFYAEYLKKYDRGKDLYATSTSSSRTLLVTDKNEKFFFAKLSLDVELGGVVRTIPSGEVARSVGMTKLIGTTKVPNENFIIMRESLGIMPKNLKRGGQILREIPKEIFDSSKKVVPLFSLYARPELRFETLLERMTKQVENPREYIREKILRPFARAWVDWAVDSRTVMEAHAQNVLIQLDSDGLPTGKFFLRDLGGFNTAFDENELKNYLPTFSSHYEDYHLRFSSDARRQSLKIYFEGGFLHNIDNELRRIGIYGENIKARFRDILVDELKIKGRKYGINFELSENSIYQNLESVLQALQKEKGAPKWGCISAFMKKAPKNVILKSKNKATKLFERLLKIFN